jgi:hypothetical protein
VITLLAGFLIFIVAFMLAGGKHEWSKAKEIIDQTEREGHAPNYHYIALRERAIWGAAFHNSGTKLCECNTICHPETFYIPTPQPLPKPIEEWRDREGA